MRSVPCIGPPGLSPSPHRHAPLREDGKQGGCAESGGEREWSDNEAAKCESPEPAQIKSISKKIGPEHGGWLMQR